MKALLALAMFASLATAGVNDKAHLPKSFTVNGSKAVFADFTEAIYDINYDLTKKQAFVRASIALETFEDGYPVFDSYDTPVAVVLDGQNVGEKMAKTPNGETTLRVANKMVPAGRHTLVVDVMLKTLVEFTADGVKSAFWTSDLDERKFLERYMPANFEFDQVKMTFRIMFTGATRPQKIYTNGVVSQMRNNAYVISYPAYYTASSIFFHTVPEGATSELRFSLKSIDGREIPAVVYVSKSSFGANLQRLKERTSAIFQELESDYGPFPHPSITVLQAGMGGMEYCGATMTDMSALGHELFHSYFARGVMPANGNAGWIDEALASWRDDGYQSISTLSGTSNMSGHPYYTRTTDTAAYSFGERFMSYLDNKLKSKGGLKPYMRTLVEKEKFKPFFIEELIAHMSKFYGVDLGPDFKKFTFGGRNTFTEKSAHSHKIHRKMTVEEMQQYL